MTGLDFWKQRELDFWKGLEQVGWLARLTAAEQLTLRERILQAFNTQEFNKRENTHAAYAFSVLADFCFDLGCTAYEGLYTYTVEALAAASRGHFTPTNIYEKFDPAQHTAVISFHHGGQQFSCEVPWQCYWCEPAIFDLVNEALAASGGETRFLGLPVHEEEICFVFIPPAIFNKAMEAGIIPDSIWEPDGA